MIISARAVREPRGSYTCGRCNVGPLREHVVLYGTPVDGGKPFSMRLHARCVPAKRIDTEPKIAAALQALAKRVG